MRPEEENAATLNDLMHWKKSSDLKEGTHVGRYQILGLVGKGGMGSVYKAYDPDLDRSIAIKILTVKPHEGESASRPQARLMREAQALAKLSHPNVVSIFDVGRYEDSVYIAMEYVKGKTLREWIKEEHPQQKAILKTLSKAGKGLHAAHNEGIVHRDFKPENVIVGDRGQVKVLDFGLARAAGTEATTIPHDEQEKVVQESTSGEKLLATPLTQAGVAIGTIAYMAPEHFLMKELDEKTDQFSFCVTLFEALYGKRPFPGVRLDEFEENLTSGWIEIPQEAYVPKWIERILLKGLSVEKNKRHQSMLELLDELKNDPEIARTRRRRIYVMTLLVIFSTSIIFGLGYYAFFKSSRVCTGADLKVAGIWNDERKEKISQSFAKTGLSYANDSFVRVVKRFDEYLGEWKIDYSYACEATRIRGEQSEEIMDLKMRCLNSHLQNANALIKVLSDADKKVVENSIHAAIGLEAISECADVDALAEQQQRIRPPKDEDTKKRVEGIREKLAKVRALEKSGKYQEGLVHAKNAVDIAEKTGYMPVQAEAMYLLGSLQERAGRYEQVKGTWETAAMLAEKSRHDEIKAIALIDLIYVVGYQLDRFEEAQQWIRLAEAAVVRLEDEGQIKARWLNIVGVVFDVRGKIDKAIEYYQKSLKVLEKYLGPEHLGATSSLNNLGAMFARRGNFDKALDYNQKALKIREKALGPEHPLVASSLNNLGSVFKTNGDYDKALGYYQKALKIWKEALGPEHPLVASSLNNLGNVFKAKGDCDKALGYYQKALKIWEKTLGPDHPRVASTIRNVGVMLVDQGLPKQALEPLDRAVDICKKNICKPKEFAKGLFNLARALVATNGDKNRAIRLAKQAQEVFSKTPKRFKKELEEVDDWLKKHDRSNPETAHLRR